MGAGLLLATLLLGQVRVEPGAPLALHTRAKTVATLAKLEPGEPLTYEKLARAERELRSSNLFDEVHVTLLMAPEAAARQMYLEPTTAYADVAITLEEKRFFYAFPFGNVQPGNQSIGLFAADVNLFGAAKTLFSAGEYGDKTKQLYVLFRDPAFAGSRFLGYDVSGLLRDDHLPIYVNRTAAQTVLITQGGGALALRLNWHRDFATLFQYSLDRLELAQVVPSDNAAPPPMPSTVNLGGGLDSTVRGELRYDSRTSEEGLFSGALSRLWVELSDDRIGSGYSYTREMMAFGGWFNLRHVNLSVRGQAGVEYSTGPGGIPITKEFTLGGTDLRGYLKREFRGDTTASLQNEAVFPILSVWKLKVRGDAFYDAGLVYRREMGFSRQDFRQGAGGGVRIYFRNLAIPVVGFDVGYGFEENAVGYYFTFGLPET